MNDLNIPQSTDLENLETFGDYHHSQVKMLQTLFDAIICAEGNSHLMSELATLGGYLANHFESDSETLINCFLSSSMARH